MSDACSSSSTARASSGSMTGIDPEIDVRDLAPRVVEQVAVLEVQERLLVDGVGEDLDQQRLQRHGQLLFVARRDERERGVRCGRRGRSSSRASTLRRSSGSVLDGRR